MLPAEIQTPVSRKPAIELSLNSIGRQSCHTAPHEPHCAAGGLLYAVSTGPDGNGGYAPQLSTSADGGDTWTVEDVGALDYLFVCTGGAGLLYCFAAD